MDLKLDVRTRGRAPKPLDAEFIGVITESDLARANAVEQGVQTPKIKKLRDSHHGLARILATGVSQTEASAVTGYSISRISILKADPQFQELCAFYRSHESEAVADFRKLMNGLGIDALVELKERLEDSPDDMSNAFLLEVTKLMADRTGHAPQAQKPQAGAVNVNLSVRMERARDRVEALRAPKVIDHE